MKKNDDWYFSFACVLLYRPPFNIFKLNNIFLLCSLLSIPSSLIRSLSSSVLSRSPEIEFARNASEIAFGSSRCCSIQNVTSASLHFRTGFCNLSGVAGEAVVLWLVLGTGTGEVVLRWVFSLLLLLRRRMLLLLWMLLLLLRLLLLLLSPPPLLPPLPPPPPLLLLLRSPISLSRLLPLVATAKIPLSKLLPSPPRRERECNTARSRESLSNHVSHSELQPTKWTRILRPCTAMISHSVHSHPRSRASQWSPILKFRHPEGEGCLCCSSWLDEDPAAAAAAPTMPSVDIPMPIAASTPAPTPTPEEKCDVLALVLVLAIVLERRSPLKLLSETLAIVLAALILAIE